MVDNIDELLGVDDLRRRGHHILELTLLSSVLHPHVLLRILDNAEDIPEGLLMMTLASYIPKIVGHDIGAGFCCVIFHKGVYLAGGTMIAL